MKRWIFHRIIEPYVYPHIVFARNPFKMVEFKAMIGSASWRSTDTILDIGCGRGLQSALFAKRAHKVVGIDISAGAIGCAADDHRDMVTRGALTFRNTSIEEAAFDEASFDKVVSVCVLEHIPDYRSVLREAFRVMKSGGHLVMSVDSLATITQEEVRREHAEKHHVERYFEPESLRRDLEEIGFADVSVRPLLCSAYAARAFARGIREDFPYRYTGTVWMYLVLRFREFFSARRGHGIYLLVRASKR